MFSETAPNVLELPFNIYGMLNGAPYNGSVMDLDPSHTVKTPDVMRASTSFFLKIGGVLLMGGLLLQVRVEFIHIQKVKMI